MQYDEIVAKCTKQLKQTNTFAMQASRAVWLPSLLRREEGSSFTGMRGLYQVSGL